MPTYEYACTACKHEFEKFQSMKDEPVKKCPKCGKNKVKRLISKGGGILFKGSGFYQTDYRSTKYQESAKKDIPAPAAESTSKTSPKSENPAKNPSVEAVGCLGGDGFPFNGCGLSVAKTPGSKVSGRAFKNPGRHETKS